jgi:hypothetical protein
MDTLFTVLLLVAMIGIGSRLVQLANARSAAIPAMTRAHRRLPRRRTPSAPADPHESADVLDDPGPGPDESGLCANAARSRVDSWPAPVDPEERLTRL